MLKGGCGTGRQTLSVYSDPGLCGRKELRLGLEVQHLGEAKAGQWPHFLEALWSGSPCRGNQVRGRYIRGLIFMIAGPDGEGVDDWDSPGSRLQDDGFPCQPAGKAMAPRSPRSSKGRYKVVWRYRARHRYRHVRAPVFGRMGRVWASPCCDSPRQNDEVAGRMQVAGFGRFQAWREM